MRTRKAKRMPFYQNSDGFTLFEVLVAVFIIALIAQAGNLFYRHVLSAGKKIIAFNQKSEVIITSLTLMSQDILAMRVDNTHPLSVGNSHEGCITLLSFIVPVSGAPEYPNGEQMGTVTWQNKDGILQRTLQINGKTVVNTIDTPEPLLCLALRQHNQHGWNNIPGLMSEDVDGLALKLTYSRSFTTEKVFMFFPKNEAGGHDFR